MDKLLLSHHRRQLRLSRRTRRRECRRKLDKALPPISDERGNIEIEGEALANELGKFGTWTVREEPSAP